MTKRCRFSFFAEFKSCTVGTHHFISLQHHGRGKWDLKTLYKTAVRLSYNMDTQLGVRRIFFRGTGCPGKWWSHHACRYLGKVEMWHLGQSGGFSGARFTAALDFKGLF